MMFTLMMFKSKLLNHRLLSNNFAYQFAVKKSTKKEQPKQFRQPKQSGIIIRNDNLRFQASDYFIHVFPFHPEIIKKSISAYQINKHSTVLALTFVKKDPPQNYDSMLQKNNSTPQMNNPWNQRKSITLKFSQVPKLISVLTNSGKEALLQKKKYQAPGSVQNKFIKKLNIKDFKEENKIQFKFQQIQQNNKGEQKKLWQIKTKMPYQQFEIMSYLIKESLFDLSGLKLIFDLKRNEELAKFSKKQDGAREVEDLMKEYEIKKEDDRVA